MSLCKRHIDGGLEEKRKISLSPSTTCHCHLTTPLTFFTLRYIELPSSSSSFSLLRLLHVTGRPGSERQVGGNATAAGQPQ